MPGKFFQLKENFSFFQDILKIELELDGVKLPWPQIFSLLKFDFEITATTINLKNGAPPKESLLNLDPSLVQDHHWKLLSVTYFQ